MAWNEKKRCSVTHHRKMTQGTTVDQQHGPNERPGVDQSLRASYLQTQEGQGMHTRSMDVGHLEKKKKKVVIHVCATPWYWCLVIARS